MLPAILLIAGGAYLWASDDGDAGLAAGAVIVLVGVILLVVSMLIIQAMRGVFGVALYRFATDGAVTSGFTEADLNSAVGRSKSRHVLRSGLEQPRVVRADPVDAERRELRSIRSASSTVQAITSTPTA